MPREQGVRVVARNRRATHDYTIGDTWEAGLVLQGTEVKSLRAGKATLTDAFAQVDERGEVWMYNLHIPEYAFGTWRNHDVMRKRKLLLNVDLGKGSLLSHTDKVRHDVRQWKSSLAVRSKISHRKRGMP